MKTFAQYIARHCAEPGHTEYVPTGEDQPGANHPKPENCNPTEPPETPENPNNWEGSAKPQIGRRVPLPSKRACGIAGIVAGLLDLAILLNDGRPVLRSLFAAIFLGVFVYLGMRLMTALRRKIRPELSEHYRQIQSPNNPAGAPKGGWANPTGAQKFARRIARITANYGKRRPPRR